MKRKTSQRAAIEQVFCQLDRPLGIEEILETGRMAVESLNQATVYRNVKLLLENGWLKQVCHPSLGTLYERTGKGHHHHFHCRVCNRVYDLPGCALNEREARSLRVPRGGSRVFPVWGLPRLATLEGKPRCHEASSTLVTLSLLLALFSTIF